MKTRVIRMQECTLHDDDVMPFGAHRGKKLGEIPSSYWDWFLNQKWRDQWPSLVQYAEIEN